MSIEKWPPPIPFVHLLENGRNLVGCQKLSHNLILILVLHNVIHYYEGFERPTSSSNHGYIILKTIK
jgi:hypothetical protein